MKNLLRKYIREQIERLFELNSQGEVEATTKVIAEQNAAETIKNYEDIKTQQIAQLDALQANLKREKARQLLNKDKMLKLNKTFSQVQDPELAQAPGGKAEDNKIKTMKRAEYNKQSKEFVDSVKELEDQIQKAEENITNIDNMVKNTSASSKTAASPVAPGAPTAPVA